jgi:hypothetical protein
MKVTKQQLININNNLFNVSTIKGVKFAYAVTKNKKKLESEMSALSEMQKPSDSFSEYQQTLQTLARKHARRNKEGQIETQTAENGSVGYVIDDDNIIFNEAKKRLDKKFSESIKERQETEVKIQEILEEEVETDSFGFHKVLLKDLPEELNAIEIELLEFMIDE